MKENQAVRPREGVWYALAQDYLFTVQHPFIATWGPPGGFYMVADEEEAERPTSAERVAIAKPSFYIEAVFIGELD